MFRSVLVPINRAGWPFIGAALVLAILLGLLWEPLFWLGLLAVAFLHLLLPGSAKGDAEPPRAGHRAG